MTVPICQPQFEYAKDFTAWLQAQNRSLATVKGYLDDVRYFSRWLEQSCNTTLQPAQLTADVISKYQQELLIAGAKPQTVNRKLAALAAYGRWAKQAGYLMQNPALQIHTVKKTSSPPIFLDQHQQTALRHAIEVDLKLARQRYPRLWLIRLRDALMTLLLLDTGLRISELCALKMEDIQIGEMEGHVVVHLKDGDPSTSILLTGPVRQWLIEWLQNRPAVAQPALFVSQRGAVVDARSVQRAVHRYATDSGLFQATPQTLRYTFRRTVVALEN